MTTQARSLEDTARVYDDNSGAQIAGSRLQDELYALRQGPTTETKFAVASEVSEESPQGPMTAGDAPKEKSLGPVDDLFRTVTPEKDMPIDKRVAAAKEAVDKAFASGKAEDKAAAAKALVQYLGNVRIEIGSKASDLLESAAAGACGDTAALTAARILLGNGNSYKHEVYAYSTIARIATNPDNAEVGKEAKFVLGKVRARLLKLAEDGPDADEPGLDPAVKKKIQDLSPKEIDAIKNYNKTLLKVIDNSIERAKKEKENK